MSAISTCNRKTLQRAICLVLALLSLFDAVNAQTGSTWTARSYPVENQWISAVYGNGLFVATASSGTGNRIMTSPDGINWTARTTPADNVWASITYGQGLFVAVGSPSASTNTVMTSPDGINWTLRASADAGSQWTAVAYGNGVFVALAQSGTTRVMTSTDGITWTARTGVAAVTWGGLTYGNGLFVGVSQSITDQIVTSPDGITWTARTTPAATGWWSIAYGNGVFVTVGAAGIGQRAMTSPDGITWTLRNTAADNGWRAVRYGGGLFVAVAITGTGNRIMTSTDGITWTSRTSTADVQWRGLAYGSGMWVATAIGAASTGTRVMTSGSILLPVTWLSFTAKSIGNKNELNWQTATEIDNSHFDIERSSDALYFEKIGEVKAAENAANGSSYFFTDANPLHPVNYYRLKQIDNNGKFEYSKTIQVILKNMESFSVVPNPSRSFISVKGLADGNERIEYQIVSMAGVQLRSDILPNNRSIDISALPKGTYMLKIGEQSHQFIRL